MEKIKFKDLDLFLRCIVILMCTMIFVIALMGVSEIIETIKPQETIIIKQLPENHLPGIVMP